MYLSSFPQEASFCSWCRLNQKSITDQDAEIKTAQNSQPGREHVYSIIFPRFRDHEEEDPERV